MFIDVLDANDLNVVETINAENDVSMEGFEFTMTAMPISRLSFSINYTYLEGDMPLQPHTLQGGELQSFVLTQTPRHAGSLSVDYTFKPFLFGTLRGHFDVISTSPYHYFSDISAPSDSYTLLNANMMLTDVSMGDLRDSLQINAWVKNITDEEYRVSGFNFPDAIVSAVYGEPRTAGVEVIFKF
jgi:iron complex outermembrane receptor protein